jgi:hypothetical protein
MSYLAASLSYSMFYIMRIPLSQELRIAAPSTRVELNGLCRRAGSVPDSPGINRPLSRQGFMRVVMTPAGKGGESQARQTRKY